MTGLRPFRVHSSRKCRSGTTRRLAVAVFWLDGRTAPASSTRGMFAVDHWATDLPLVVIARPWWRALRSRALVLAILVACSILSIIPSNAIAQVKSSLTMSPATYAGLVTSAAYPTSNPNCTTPVVQCSNSQGLSAPGTIVVDPPGTSLESGHLTLGTTGPSISVVSTSLSFTNSGWDRGSSLVSGQVDYSVEIVGPQAKVPVLIAVSEVVSASNGWYAGPQDTVASVYLKVTQSGISTIVACASSPGAQCGQQQSISGTYSLSFDANTPITVELGAMAWTYSIDYTGVYSAFIDPTFSIDPSFPEASSYTVLVSPGITQEGALLFADGFEIGDTSAWSHTVP